MMPLQGAEPEEDIFTLDCIPHVVGLLYELSCVVNGIHTFLLSQLALS